MATMPFFNSLKYISILRVISAPRNIYFKMRYLLVMNFEEVRLNDDYYYLHKTYVVITCNLYPNISALFVFSHSSDTLLSLFRYLKMSCLF